MKPAIGLIGAGLMGVGIGANLLKHGYPLTVLEHPGNQPLDPLVAAGAQTTPSLQKLASRVEVLILCVTGSPQVESVLTGASGALKSLRPGSVVIDCSTALPSSTERMAAAASQAGCAMIDAAMTRTPKEAAAGRLALLVGGDVQIIERVRPVLESFSESIFHTGPVGSGHRMKLLHNFVSLGLVTLIAEAAACARQAGVADAVFADVLSRGGGGGVALDRLKPYLLEGDKTALRFTVANAGKDLGYYATMAADSGAERTIAAAVLESIERSAGSEPQAMVPEMVRLIAARATPR